MTWQRLLPFRGSDAPEEFSPMEDAILNANTQAEIDAAVGKRGVTASVTPLEFGDKQGHKFHGNQYKDEDGEKDKAERKIKNIIKMVPWKKELERDSKLFNTLFNPTKEQRKLLKASAFARIEALELAIVALAKQEFGDVLGHPFRGNQWGSHASDTVLRHTSDIRGDLYHVVKSGEKVGSVQQMHEFIEQIPGNGRGVLAMPKGAPEKEFDTIDEAVKHVLDVAHERGMAVAASG